jgi:DNA-binding CsgD family transcriptional regulator/tetratricopeptide (TPR) repeat protein
MKPVHGIQVNDPLAIPVEEAPRTIEYLTQLREEADPIRYTDPARFFSLVDRGAVIAGELGAPIYLCNFLFSRVWYHKHVSDDLTSARSDLHSIEGLLNEQPHEFDETFRMRFEYHYGSLHWSEEAPADARRHYLAGLELARQTGDSVWQASFHNELASLHGDLLGDNQGQLDHLSAALRICPKETPMYDTLLFNLANLSHYCEDYVTARAYLDESLALETASMTRRAHRFGLASLLCLEERNLDDALLWANKAVDAARGYNPISICEALDVRGGVHFERGNVLAAIRDLEEALSLETDETQRCMIKAGLAKFYAAIAAGRSNEQSDDGLTFDPADKARELLHEAEETLPGILPSMQISVVVRMVEARRRLGDFQGAFHALEQVDELKREQSLGKIRNEIGSLRLLMKLEREEHEREIQRMKTEQVEKELGNTTLQFLAQTELLRDLRSDLLKMVRKIPPSDPVARELRDRIKNLPCEAVDWEKFDMQFKAVHPDFIRNLIERAPDLTPTEIRICTMLRMNLKSHEIAGIFCITEAGVVFHRTNIRKKLKLGKDEKLPIVFGAM